METNSSVIEINPTIWKSTVEIGDLFDRWKEEVITVEEFASELVERLSKNKYASNDDIKDIIGELKLVEDMDELDRYIDDLYDFGDNDHRIWFKGSERIDDDYEDIEAVG